MIYKKDNIDMSLVTCPYDEQQGYISIDDEYTNDVLKMAGYSDISGQYFQFLCMKGIFVDNLKLYALKSPEYSYWYARDALKGRFELGESLITTNAEYSYYYAKYVIKGRFELGEPVIATVAESSYKYAKYVLGGRFKLGELIISTDKDYNHLYASNVIAKI